MKPLFSSKVFWIAVLQGVIGIWAVVQTNYEGLGWVAIIKSILDIALRFFTTQPLSGAVKLGFAKKVE